MQQTGVSVSTSALTGVWNFSILVRVAANMCVCVCVCVYAYTHTLHGEYFDEGPRIDTRQLEGQKNPDGIYLRIHISVYVYKVHMYLQYTGW